MEEHEGKRPRDLADMLDVPEAALLAARVGQDATRIAAHPDMLIPRLDALGEVMALTRVDACVHEKVGTYNNYQSGPHAAMVLNGAIDLRIFPRHWVHAYAVEAEGATGPKRSIQIFDAAGDAVHKVHLRTGSDHAAWDGVIASLRSDDQAPGQEFAPREPAEPPKSVPEKLDILRIEWAKLTDTHQFLRLCAKLKMNRLGAYRIAGAPFVRQLDPAAVDTALEAVRDAGLEVMIFVGNRGCIQIHGGPIGTLKATGPWQNVLDPGFNLHLRRDRVAELWSVEKPTQRGPAVSIEGFAADGSIIFQIFGLNKEGQDSRPAWNALVANLPGLAGEV
nr:ChuX/HutX family heme-like substrate-binding protein [Roseobacter sp. HKCCA0434]